MSSHTASRGDVLIIENCRNSVADRDIYDEEVESMLMPEVSLRSPAMSCSG